jgi:glycosidase
MGVVEETEREELEGSDFVFAFPPEVRAAELRRQRLGVTHAAQRSPRDPQPGEPVALELTIGPDESRNRATVHWTSDGRDPEPGASTETPMELVDIEWDELVFGYVRRFRTELPGQPSGTVVRYRVKAHDATGETVSDEGRFFAYAVDEYEQPEWARDAVVYHVFVDRFNPGAGRDWNDASDDAPFYGGTLRGVTEKLDYIADLGVTAIWLSPIFPSPTYHGYDSTDLFDIEPRLGAKADLRELLDGAHARGLRVLLDFVPNHWSSRHPTFQAATSDPDSPYREWYVFRRWPDEYDSFLNLAPTLPQVNLRSPHARRHMLDAARHWLEFGVDGYRIDHTIGPTPDFWADLRLETRAARPDCWSFGESTLGSKFALTFEGLLDGSLDFELSDALRNTFALRRWDVARFASFLDAHERFFPQQFARPSFLDNHDMNRFLWSARLDHRRLRLAALCQFTLTGPPIVYYGTEVGLAQERDVRETSDKEARLPMLWDDEQDAELREYYKGLIRVRRERPELSRAGRTTLHADADLLVYARGELVVALNLAEEPRSWESLELPPLSGAVTEKGEPLWQA